MRANKCRHTGAAKKRTQNRKRKHNQACRKKSKVNSKAYKIDLKPDTGNNVNLISKRVALKMERHISSPIITLWVKKYKYWKKQAYRIGRTNEHNTYKRSAKNTQLMR